MPVNGGPGWESARTATWPASTATLIAGERLVALNTAVVDAARMHVVDPIRQNWIEWFGDEFNHQAAVPQALGSETLTVEEHPVHLIDVGGADGALATVLHIPELDTVCTGDAVYNNIHMWLWNSIPESRQIWLSTTDKIADMNPATIIAGHKDPDAADDNAARQITQSRSYVEAFDRAIAELPSAGCVIDEMTKAFPGYGNPYTLFLAAHSQYQT